SRAQPFQWMDEDRVGGGEQGSSRSNRDDRQQDQRGDRNRTVPHGAKQPVPRPVRSLFGNYRLKALRHGPFLFLLAAPSVGDPRIQDRVQEIDDELDDDVYE